MAVLAKLLAGGGGACFPALQDPQYQDHSRMTAALAGPWARAARGGRRRPRRDAHDHVSGTLAPQAPSGEPDPLAPHDYTYAAGDPINKWDPTGFAPEDSTDPDKRCVENCGPGGEPKPSDDPAPGEPGSEQNPIVLPEEIISVTREKQTTTIWDWNRALGNLGSFSQRFGDRFVSNYSMTTKVLVSPFGAAWRFLWGGKRVETLDEALELGAGVATQRAFAVVVAEYFAQFGLGATAMAEGALFQGGLAVSAMSVVGAGALGAGIQIAGTGLAAWFGIMVGSALEAGGYAIYTSLAREGG